MKRERRFLQSEVRMIAGESPKITGYAAVFGKKSHDLGDFVEVIDRHAFDECLADNPDIVGLYNHSEDKVLGRTSSGTMRVSTDDTGLKYEIDPPSTSYANDLLISMGRKDVKASSFAFYTLNEKWSYDTEARQNVRTILKARVVDCSVVTNGAYPDASSQLRSLFPDCSGELPEEIKSKVLEMRSALRKEKRYKNVIAAVAGSTWAIQPEKLETICALINARASGLVATKEEIQAAMMGYDDADGANTSSGVAVIPIYGTIGQRMTLMTEFSGGASCEGVTRDFRAALADDSVSAIVLDIDSPGGTVTGVPELAEEIRAARGQKPIVAVANGLAASAAYWIASAADKIAVIPSGQVGSIGVYRTHQDVSGYMEKVGVSISFIQAGKYKTEGNPYEPLTDDAKSDMQGCVDTFYEMFVDAVAEGRGVSTDTVKADYGQGRVLLAKDALSAGMVDSIATLDEVVAGLAKDKVTDGEIIITVAETVDAEAATTSSCSCECDGCLSGNCSGCTNDMCDDTNCIGCGDDFNDDEDYDDFVEASTSGIELNADKPKTKRVDGEDLEKGAFAYQGSDDTADWKLPIEFSTDEKSEKHVRNAIARWDDTDMPNAEEKDKARGRIKVAAKKYDIELADGDLALVSTDGADKAEIEARLNTIAKVKVMTLY